MRLSYLVTSVLFAGAVMLHCRWALFLLANWHKSRGSLLGTYIALIHDNIHVLINVCMYTDLNSRISEYSCAFCRDAG